MNIIRNIMKWIGIIVLIPMVYFLVSLLLTIVPINSKKDHSEKNKAIYLHSNGVHLNVIIAKDQLAPKLLKGLRYFKEDNYFAFGWGDKNFYLHTPTWGDLTFNNAFRALFLKSPALIHLTRYTSVKEDWVEIEIDTYQMNRINHYINNSFFLDSLNNKVLLTDKGYATNDDFYEALGNFTCFKTCNTWVNSGLKESDIKACLWTPYDFGLYYMHK